MFHSKACRIAFYKSDKANKPKSRKTWTDEQIRYLVEEKDRGGSLRAIAKHIGHSFYGCNSKYYEIKAKGQQVSHKTPDPPGGSMGQEDDDAHAEIESLTATEPSPGTLGDVAGDPDEPEKAEPLWKQAYYRLKPDGQAPR